MGPDPPVVECPHRFSPLGGMANVGHGTQTSAKGDVDVPIHWSGAGNGGNGGDWVYIARRKNMVAQYIATRPIMDLCLAAERNS